MKKIIKEELAFTLAEIMIVFLIIGIIASVTTIGINSMTTKTKNKYLTTAAYLIIKDAVGNMMADDADGLLPATGVDTCKLFVKYVNILGSYDCSQTGTATSGASIASKTPNFTLSNGMKFYNFGAALSGAKFYYFYVDIDGKSRNSIVDKDVIRFSVSQDGYVSPSYDSIASSSKDYMTAVIKGNDSKIDADGNISATPGGVLATINGKSLFTFKEAACYSGFVTGTYCTSGTNISANSQCSGATPTYKSCYPEIVIPKGLSEAR